MPVRFEIADLQHAPKATGIHPRSFTTPTHETEIAMPSNPARPSRRRFLQGSASAAAIFGAPAILAAADTTPEPTKPADPKPPQTAANPAVAATTQNTRLNLAVIGVGGQGRYDMRNYLSLKENVVAICDVDEKQIAEAKKAGGGAAKDAKVYTDYRRLLED